MNYFLVTDRQTDGQKATHKSPPCMSTGGLKKGSVKLLNYIEASQMHRERVKTRKPFKALTVLMLLNRNVLPFRALTCGVDYPQSA